ncbi:hypothetical protein [uncultured Bartonella sp.]|uniref:hypothetical protein n=1 Tax=uncultured Bartonella sp. TaxID=104108 RepID=UPI0026199D20|nr:hypothetical protein [uncultured Bartonella sp.]
MAELHIKFATNAAKFYNFFPENFQNLSNMYISFIRVERPLAIHEKARSVSGVRLFLSLGNSNRAYFFKKIRHCC